MKKILTLAIMAILLGGFAFNANAQKKTTKPDEKKSTTTVVKKDTQGETNEKLLKDYESAVEQCLTMYNNSKNGNVKVDPKAFDKSLSTAENLKAQLEKVQKELSRKQVDRFNKATKKLSQVYKKG